MKWTCFIDKTDPGTLLRNKVDKASYLDTNFPLGTSKAQDQRNEDPALDEVNIHHHKNAGEERNHTGQMIFTIVMVCSTF